MRAKRKSTIYYVGWNSKGFVCEQPFFTKKSAIDHGLDCDREGNGIFLVEVPAIITPVYGKSTTRKPATMSGLDTQAT
jgi:hypothetical protein